MNNFVDRALSKMVCGLAKRFGLTSQLFRFNVTFVPNMGNMMFRYSSEYLTVFGKSVPLSNIIDL